MIMVLAPHRAAAAAAKATHLETTSRDSAPRGNQGNGGAPAAMAQVVKAAAAANRGAGES